MTDRYGVWSKADQRWVGFGVGFEFHPFCWLREEAEEHCAKAAAYEARPINEANLLDALPYPKGSEKGAKVRTHEDGTMSVVFDETHVKANFEVGHLVHREGRAPEFVATSKP